MFRSFIYVNKETATFLRLKLKRHFHNTSYFLSLTQNAHVRYTSCSTTSSSSVPFLSQPKMSSKRHSLPSSFEHRGDADFLAKYNDFEVLKGLKQLPFDEGDFSLTLPPIVQSLEQFSPPPLALPKNWLRGTAKDSAAAAPNLETGSLHSQKRGESIRSSEVLSSGLSSSDQAEKRTPVAAVPLPNIPATSPKKAETSSSGAPSTSSDASPLTLQTDAAEESSKNGPGLATINHQRQLSTAFVRGQRLPFSIVEEDEQETSESCYSTEDGPVSSNSQRAEADTVSQQQSHTQSPSIVSNQASQCSSRQSPSRAHLIKDRMKRILSAKALRTRVRD